MPDLGYYAIHTTLAKVRGPARAFDCACGTPATQWAYTGPREAGERCPWSEDVNDYVAMCGRCHSRYDRAAVRASERRPADAMLF